MPRRTPSRPSRPRPAAGRAALAALAAGALCAGLLAAPSAAAPVEGVRAAAEPRGAAVQVRDGCLDSRPEPGSSEPVRICWTSFRPAGATARTPVPLLLDSHGWGGSRRTDPASVERWTSAGYGVLSFDQRGFGQSGGVAHVMNPAFEGRDVRALVRLVAGLPWVQQDGPGDPRMGAIGGSYGGGYQFLAAFELLRTRGKPVLDALAPQITWHDLRTSLAPQGAVRTLWAVALSAAALPTQALGPEVYKALVEGAALGTLPDGSVPGTEDLDAFFERNGPSWHVRNGRRLDVPVLLGQGTTDSLFPLDEGFRNWRRALTPRARAQSVLIGYNGGHVLPSVFPRGVQVTSDPCSRRLGGGSFDDLAQQFFDHVLKGEGRPVRGRGKVHLATPGSRCVTTATGRANRKVAVGQVASTTAAGLPLAYPVLEGPVTVAGTAHLTGTLTALGLDNRAFYGLGVGTSPLDATLVQNNMLPLRALQPVVGERVRVDLPAVGVQVPAGQTLYLLVSAISDTSAGMGSRVPGAVVLDDVVVHLPVPR